MNPRERVLAALGHRPVDRVPIDFGGTRQSGISAFSYGPLRRELGLDDARPFRVFDLYQMLAEIEDDVAERLGSDCVALNRRAVAFGIANDRWRAWQLDDGTAVRVPYGFEPETEADGDLVLRRDGQVIARMPAGGFYFDRFEIYPGAAHPDLETWRAPRLSQADIDHFGAAAAALAANTDKAVIAALGPPYELFNGLGQGGYEAWMITFATEDDYVRQLYQMLVDAWIDNLRAFHAAVGDRVQVLQIADDFGTQHGPFLSVEMFRDKLLPAYRRGLDWVHANTNWKVLLHSDGAIEPLMESIVEMGVDALNPIQTSAPGMDPAALRRKYAGRLAFWGAGCDPQSTLQHGTPRQVADEVRANVAALESLGGGHVLAPIHNVQANVPAANVVAMFDAAREIAGTSPGTRA